MIRNEVNASGPHMDICYETIRWFIAWKPLIWQDTWFITSVSMGTLYKKIPILNAWVLCNYTLAIRIIGILNAEKYCQTCCGALLYYDFIVLNPQICPNYRLLKRFRLRVRVCLAKRRVGIFWQNCQAVNQIEMCVFELFVITDYHNCKCLPLNERRVIPMFLLLGDRLQCIETC